MNIIFWISINYIYILKNNLKLNNKENLVPNIFYFYILHIYEWLGILEGCGEGEREDYTCSIEIFL